MSFMLIIVLLNGQTSNVYMPTKNMCIDVMDKALNEDINKKIQFTKCFTIKQEK